MIKYCVQIPDHVPVSNTSVNTTKMSAWILLVTDESFENLFVIVPDSRTLCDKFNL